SLSVFALSWLKFSDAFRGSHGPCPNVTAVGDLDMHRFSGVWYTHSIYPPLSLRLRKCQSTEFINYDTHYYKVRARELSTQTDTVRVREAKITKVIPHEGSYILETTNKVFPGGIQIHVLDTDYDNYAIRYMCIENLNIFHYEWAVIQFRKRLPKSHIIFIAQVLAHRSGISFDDMSKVPQEACPPDT
ncbi:hypothetical protein KR018_000974, partial [Drosophila ironensis]